jgi:tripartite-type tricarboxylate transporter receptor subunit TctC
MRLPGAAARTSMAARTESGFALYVSSMTTAPRAVFRYSSALSFVKQNRIRILGVTAPKRVATTPDVPTMSEQGFKEMTTGSWQGVFLPKNTPRAIVSKMLSVTLETMKSPEVMKRLQEGGVDIVVSKSPEDFAKFVASETARFGKVIKDAKIETE